MEVLSNGGFIDVELCFFINRDPWFPMQIDGY